MREPLAEAPRVARIALVQTAPGESLEASAEQALARMREARSAGAEIVAFPEVHLSPFFPQFPGRDASGYALTIDHPIITAFRDLSRELGIVAMPNVYLEENGRFFDASLVIGTSGELLGISKMVHVVQAPCFYEQDYYEPSDTGFRVYETPFGRIGVVVCFDRHYPESLRTCVLRGAELIVIPTVNTRDEDLEMFEWELRVAAAQNGVFIGMCNRAGREHAMDFCGASIVVGPAGEVIAVAGDTEEILHAELDLGRIEEERDRRPYLELRRPETFER
ncbi:MAG: carbon-nitrogen hydrolase family protein [Gemmatimonadota bacterium]